MKIVERILLAIGAITLWITGAYYVAVVFLPLVYVWIVAGVCLAGYLILRKSKKQEQRERGDDG